MFCSKCGKTMMPEDLRCPHCGNEVGENRSAGTPYTSCQPHILPDAPAGSAAAAYTRTTYTTMPEEQQEEGAVDSRTTYRPVYDDSSAPEEVRKEMRARIEGGEAAAESAPRPKPEDLPEDIRNTLSAVDEELKMESVDTSELRSRPIESTGRAGISAGVETYIQDLEARQSRRAARRRRAYDDNEEAYATPVEETAPDYDDTAAASSGIDTEQSAVFDDIDENDFEEIRYGRTIGVKEILKVAGIMIIAAALIVGGVLWFRHFREGVSSAKIEGVTESLYSDGIATIKSHADDTYINEMINLYREDGALALTTRAEADSAAIDALLPEEPAVNDSLFVSALQTIQGNIGNALLMDASEADSASDSSAARWNIIKDSISQLESATTAQELTAILNGERITVATSPTPTPVPEKTYNTLSKGDKSDEVLDMQNQLYMLGFLLDDRDGAFGTKTQTAVKMFQQAAGLEVTGIADNATLTAMFSENAPRTEYAQATSAPAAQPAPEPAAEAPAEAAAEEPAEAAAEEPAE